MTDYDGPESTALPLAPSLQTLAVRLPRLLHDLGNPLTAITTNVEFLSDLLKDFEADIDAQQAALVREVLQELRESADRMRSIAMELRPLAAAPELRALAKATPRSPSVDEVDDSILLAVSGISPK